MYNPLLPDLTKIKIEEVENRINELNKKYMIAARLGQGYAAQQILGVLEEYKIELSRRHMEMSQKSLKNQDKSLQDFINVDN